MRSVHVVLAAAAAAPFAVAQSTNQVDALIPLHVSASTSGGPLDTSSLASGPIAAPDITLTAQSTDQTTGASATTSLWINQLQDPLQVRVTAQSRTLGTDINADSTVNPTELLLAFSLGSPSYAHVIVQSDTETTGTAHASTVIDVGFDGTIDFSSSPGSQTFVLPLPALTNGTVVLLRTQTRATGFGERSVARTTITVAPRSVPGVSSNHMDRCGWGILDWFPRFDGSGIVQLFNFTDPASRILVIGTQRLALPLPPGLTNRPGCALIPSVEVLIPFPNQGPAAPTISQLTIPNLLYAAPLDLHLQAVSLDPAIPSVSTSNSLRLVWN